MKENDERSKRYLFMNENNLKSRDQTNLAPKYLTK